MSKVARWFQAEARDATIQFMLDNPGQNPLIQLPCGCHAKGSRILMYDGSIKLVEDISVGDSLIGPDSEPRTVLQLARGRETMVRITPEKGAAFIVNKSHILSLEVIKKSLSDQYWSKFENTQIDYYHDSNEHFKSTRHLRKIVVKFEKTIYIDSTSNLAFTTEILPEDDYYGFALDGDHLYLTADFIVHHNTGKSFVIADLITSISYYWPGTYFMMLTHVEFLVDQNYKELKERWPNCPAGIFAAGLNRKDYAHPIIYGTINSVCKSPEIFGFRHFIIVDECFSADTEILTENGFIRFDQLQSEKVAQYNKNSQLISFVAPTRKINKKSDSKMLRIKSANVFDLLLTENHEMLVSTVGKTKDWVKIKAKDIKSCTQRKMLTAGFGIGDGSQLSPFEKLMICFQADGSCHRYNKNSTFIASFSFSKERKIEEFLKLMKEGAFPFREVSSKPSKNSNTKPKRRFMVYAPYTLSKDITLYFKLKEISWIKAQQIIMYMNKWDGHVASTGTYIYTSADKKAADFYQAVSSIAGMRATLSRVVDNRKATFSDIYKLFISTKVKEVTTQSWKAETIAYNDNVYCVEVPEGNIIVRRGGKTLITGNCHLISPNEETMYQQTIKKLKEKNPNLVVIGLTATGYRTKEGGLVGPSSMFDSLAYDLTTPQAFARLIGEGFLVPIYSTRTSTQLNVTGLSKRGPDNDFSPRELQKAVDIEEITYAAVQESVEAGADRKSWIVFGTGTKHIENISNMLNSFGISSVVMHSKLSVNERNRNLNLFRAGQVRAICGQRILTTGFNHRPCDLLIDMQPTESVGQHSQKGGRIMRPSPETNKKDGLWLDFGGNIWRNGPIDNPFIPCPVTGKRTGDVPLKICPACSTYNYTIVKFCINPKCRYEFIFETKLTATSSTASAMIGVTPVIEVFDVDHVSYIRHETSGKPPSVKVTYMCGVKRFHEFVCIEHGGFPAKRAQAWWMQRHASTPPTTTEEVLRLSRELRKPQTIKVHTNLQYPQILDYGY